MIDDESVTSALSTLERHAPAEGEVLAGMRTGIVRRRRRRQLASVATVAATAAAVALGVVYLTPSRGADHSGIAPAAPPAAAATPNAAEAAPPVLPFTAGWIPEGYRLDSWTAGPAEGDAQYVGSKGFQTVVVSITKDRKESMAGDVEEPATIAGRPGVIRRLSPDNKETQLIWQLADGRWAFVGGRAPTVPLATLQRVAEGLTSTPTPLPAPFRFRMPDGYKLVFWSGGNGPAIPDGSLTMCPRAVAPRAPAFPPECLSVRKPKGTAPTTTLVKEPSRNNPREVPIDQEKVVNGVLTRATADGTYVVAQLSAEYWAEASSQGAGVDVLRSAVTLVKS